MIHHDGSGRYVPEQQPCMGEEVTVWLRTTPATGRVDVRSTVDGEPRFTSAHRDRTVDGVSWWRADVLVGNPVTRYRFLVDGDWYTARGTVRHDVSDDTDFRLVSHPAPAAWTSDAVIYQIFPDRFARSAAADDRKVPDWAIPCAWDDPVIGRGPETPRQYYGGDLDGIAEHLDHIQALGADTVYLTPTFPAHSNHLYDATSFDHIDPLLGGDAALDRLSKSLHARGMRLLGDVTTNHTGEHHPWFHDQATRDFYYFDDDGGYESWCGVPSLPKLNWNSAALRERFVTAPDSVLRRWLADLDGWRVDVANMTGRRGSDDLAHEVSRLVADAVRRARPDAMLVGEHTHDAGRDLDVGGWQGTMNYAGFLRPVWTWLRSRDLNLPDFLGVPGGVPRRDGPAVVAGMREFGARMSWRSRRHSWTMLGTHDTARIRTVVGGAELGEVAAGLLATMPGTPMVFAGDELGLAGCNGEDARRTMPWHAQERWDRRTLRYYTDLLRLRREQPALRHGGLRFAHVDADAIAFWRETADARLLVFARRAAGRPIRLAEFNADPNADPDAGPNVGRATASGVRNSGARDSGGSGMDGAGTAEATNLYGGAHFDGTLPGDGPTFQVWACR